MNERATEHGGDPSGRPFSVLALHGFPGTPDDWQKLRSHSAQPDDWLIPAMPWLRSARAARASEPLTLRTALQEIVAFAAQNIQAPVHVVAHDLGGAIAWWLAALAPRLVASLTVISAPHPKVYAAARTRLEASGQRAYLQDLLADRNGAPFNTGLLQSVHDTEPVLVPLIAAALAQSDPNAVRTLYRAMLSADALDGTASFPDLRLPVLYLQGSEDTYFPPDLCEASVRGSGRWASGDLVPAAGHFPQITQPQIVSEMCSALWRQAETMKEQ